MLSGFKTLVLVDLVVDRQFDVQLANTGLGFALGGLCIYLQYQVREPKFDPRLKSLLSHFFFSSRCVS